MSAKRTQPRSSGEFCILRYDTIPAKIAFVNVSFYTNNSKMPNFNLWQSYRRWAKYTTNLGQYHTSGQNVCVFAVLLCCYNCGILVMKQWNCVPIRVQTFLDYFRNTQVLTSPSKAAIWDEPEVVLSYIYLPCKTATLDLPKYMTSIFFVKCVQSS